MTEHKLGMILVLEWEWQYGCTQFSARLELNSRNVFIRFGVLFLHTLFEYLRFNLSDVEMKNIIKILTEKSVYDKGLCDVVHWCMGVEKIGVNIYKGVFSLVSH